MIYGPATIEVTGDDWNGNRTVATVSIVRAATGDVSGFTVAPANKQVTIEWDTVLYAQSYSIHNPRYGQIREDVTSPYVWDGLLNGELYSFQLQAVLPGGMGVDAWSNTQDVIPLSERTLAPFVTETGYRSITIGWTGIAGASEYVVERSEAGGPWLVRTLTQSTTLTESDLAHDAWYAYRVTPVNQTEIVSASIGAAPDRFPNGHAAPVGSYDTVGNAFGVVVSGSYAYVADESAGLQVIKLTGGP